MKLEVSIKVNLKIDEVNAKIEEATRLALRDTIVAIANDAVKGSRVKTGNNRRSIFFGVAGMGHEQAGGEGRDSGDTWTGADESLLDENKIEGAVYSTSGYGGYLETGTVKMAARPYFKPALDRNLPKLVERIKARLA